MNEPIAAADAASTAVQTAVDENPELGLVMGPTLL
jgi:hypothetical protein